MEKAGRQVLDTTFNLIALRLFSLYLTMEFGRVLPQELPGIDFNLPPDPAFNNATFSKKKPLKKLKVHVGCTTWGRKEWVGQIFLPGTKETNFLEAYVKQFNTVELNATFYQVYSPEVIEKWKIKAASNPDFLFCPKVSKAISHIGRLQNAAELTTAYYEGIIAFGEKLGPLFLQLSDNYVPQNFADLQQYLGQLPKDVSIFVELRHGEWFANQTIREKIFNLFRELNIGAVITDTAGRRDAVHMHLPIPAAFIRFVGNNLDPSDYARADEWIERFKKWQDQGLESLFLFIHQKEENASPILADYFIQRLNKELKLEIKRPHFIPKTLELF